MIYQNIVTILHNRPNAHHHCQIGTTDRTNHHIPSACPSASNSNTELHSGYRSCFCTQVSTNRNKTFVVPPSLSSSNQHQQFIQKYRLDGMCVELLLLILLLSVQSKLIDSYVQIPIGLHKSCRLLLNTSATANATQPNIPRSNRPPKIDPH